MEAAMAIITINRSLDPMPREECLRLLADNQVGRLAVSLHGQPIIFPVNYVLDGDVVVFRTDPGEKLEGATLARVAFEIDHVNSELKQGWSVVVEGIGRYITDAIDEVSERRRNLPLKTWAPGEKEHWVEILDPQITGRRLSTTTVST
jgi:nitroimidazol reductase NimA-like FMN-containing flavoprotein (pyridoxamine 5'-phosphate oxidase superfamily)